MGMKPLVTKISHWVIWQAGERDSAAVESLLPSLWVKEQRMLLRSSHSQSENCRTKA